MEQWHDQVTDWVMSSGLEFGERDMALNELMCICDVCGSQVGPDIFRELDVLIVATVSAKEEAAEAPRAKMQKLNDGRTVPGDRGVCITILGAGTPLQLALAGRYLSLWQQHGLAFGHYEAARQLSSNHTAAWRGRTHSLAALGGQWRRTSAQDLYNAAPEVLGACDPRDEEAVHLVFLLAGLLSELELEPKHCEAILTALIPFLASPACSAIKVIAAVCLPRCWTRPELPPVLEERGVGRFLLAALIGSDVLAQSSLEPQLTEARRTLLGKLHSDRPFILGESEALLEAADAVACHSFYVGFCLPESLEETQEIQERLEQMTQSGTEGGGNEKDAYFFHLAATAMYRSLAETSHETGIDPSETASWP